jgi:hypothetical protein
MTPENLKILINGALALALLVACIAGRVPPEYAIAGVALLLVPSAGSDVLTKLRDAAAALGKKPPPAGPSVLLTMFIGFSYGSAGLGCAAANTAAAAADQPSSTTYCAARKMTVGECSVEYGAELTKCSLRSQTLEQSQACEDELRERYGREPRAGARKDGGA